MLILISKFKKRDIMVNGQIFYDILLVIAFGALIPFLIKIGLKAKKINNKEGFYNSMTCAGLLGFILIYYIVSSLIGNPLIVYPFNTLIIIWVLIILSLQILYILFIKRSIKSKKVPNFVKNEDFTFFHEIQRKSTHLVGLLLIACYFWISIPVFTWVQDLIIYFESINANIWGMVFIEINSSYIPQMVSIFAIFCTAFLITVPDIIRVMNFKYTMFKKFADVMREKERNAIGPHVSLLIGSIIPMILINEYLISVAGIIIAIFSDAAASLVGRKFGKHKLVFSERTGKSYEGLIGGFITAFLCPLPILLWGYDLYTSIILALIGAIVVSIIDIITPTLTDNILNPICASFFMYFTYLIIAII